MSDADKNEISRTHIVAKKGVDTYDKMSKVGNSSNMNTENTAGESSSTTTMEVRDYYMTPQMQKNIKASIVTITRDSTVQNSDISKVKANEIKKFNNEQRRKDSINNSH